MSELVCGWVVGVCVCVCVCVCESKKWASQCVNMWVS